MISRHYSDSERTSEPGYPEHWKNNIALVKHLNHVLEIVDIVRDCDEWKEVE